jgi:hypothetical protein
MNMQRSLRKLIRLIIESDETLPSPQNLAPVDPHAARRSKMDSLATDVARKLDLADVRYLSKSKRLYGAYTFSAVDDRNENVILKIQPENELAGYLRAQQIISRLPNRVARHLPMIYKVRTLGELNIRPPTDEFGTPENLGVIVMERLEELPGNMFDLITQPATKSMRSLESLVRDRQAFNDMIDEAMKKSERSIDSAIKNSTRKVDRDEEVERLRTMLRSASYSSEVTDDSEGAMISAIDGLSSVVWEKVNLWCRNLGVTKPGSIQSLTQMLMSSMSTLLGRRAVPKEPTRDVAGPLGRTKGIRELVKALDDLKSMNIKPSDVHGNNIMIRPETGELVLADLGHFT